MSVLKVLSDKFRVGLRDASLKRGIIIGLTLALVGVGVYVAVTHFRRPHAISINGDMTLYDNAASPASGCQGTGGYQDIGQGTAVTVSDESGTLLAKSVLLTGFDGGDGYCTWFFTVSDVPGGKKFYKVEVSHRGAISFTEAEAKSHVSLQLGSKPDNNGW